MTQFSVQKKASTKSCVTLNFPSLQNDPFCPSGFEWAAGQSPLFVLMLFFALMRFLPNTVRFLAVFEINTKRRHSLTKNSRKMYARPGPRRVQTPRNWKHSIHTNQTQQISFAHSHRNRFAAANGSAPSRTRKVEWDNHAKDASGKLWSGCW